MQNCEHDLIYQFVLLIREILYLRFMVFQDAINIRKRVLYALLLTSRGQRRRQHGEQRCEWTASDRCDYR